MHIHACLVHGLLLYVYTTVECTPGRIRETQKRGAIVCVGRIGWRMLIKTTGRVESRRDLGTGTGK